MDKIKTIIEACSSVFFYIGIQYILIDYAASLL
jgi:hypothetical protein